MEKTTVQISGEIELSYDVNSKEFKDTLVAYKDIIDAGGTKEDMLKHVAFHVTRFGYESMVEGVGYVGYNGRIPKEEPYSGIMIKNGYNDFYFEI